MTNSEDPVFERNVERLVREWADPLSEEGMERSQAEFLRGLQGDPPQSRSSRIAGILAVAASLLVCVTILWGILKAPSSLPPQPAGPSQEKPLKDWARIGRNLDKDLTKEERGFLEAAGLLKGLETPEPPKDWAPQKIAIPNDAIWSFLDKSVFEKVEVARGWEQIDEKTGMPRWECPFLVRTRSACLNVRFFPPGRISNPLINFYPRFYILEMSDALDLSDESLRWRQKGVDTPGRLPCLKPFGLQEWKNLYLAGETEKGSGWTRRFSSGGKTTSAYYKFWWEQSIPLPSLRHLFIKDRWALLVLDYQD